MKRFINLFLIVLLLVASFAFVQSSFASNAGNSNKPVCPGPANTGDTRCNARVLTDKTGQPITFTTPPGYGPANFRGAYGVSSASAPAGTVLAIVDAYYDSSIYNDLTTYSKQYGISVLPKCAGSLTTTACFANVNQNGTASPMPSGNSGWALETSLDVEVAHAMCQNCSILLVSANSSSYADLMTAVDAARTLGAKVISNSYGSNEFSGESLNDIHFPAGTVYTFSSGDSGYGAQYPAASPFVTAVGGTTLTLSGTSYVNESAWSGSGSGCSSFESKPTFQHDPSCANRTIADVSADADPNTGAAVYDSVRYQGRKGWFQVGGTSLASPLVAATYALAGGVSGSTQGNSLPYAAASGSLHDVTTGSNGSCGGSYLCTATAGYDGPTGLGTPNGLTAF